VITLRLQPTVVRTAGRELSLAWKMLWLHADCAAEGWAQAKDLYDAVLLAEAEATKVSPRLLCKRLDFALPTVPHPRTPASAAGHRAH
jgi:hypothetical protein